MNIRKNLVKKNYWLAITASFLIVLAASFWPTNRVQAQANETYAVAIDRVSTSMGDSCGGPEFYAQIYNSESKRWMQSSVVGGRNFSPPKRRDRSHGVPDDWGTSGYLNEGEKDNVQIRLMESDDSFCGGGDDHVDIARGSSRDLSIWVYQARAQGWVYFEGQWQKCPLMRLGRYPYYICEITSRGTGSESATVEVSIQFPPVK